MNNSVHTINDVRDKAPEKIDANNEYVTPSHAYLLICSQDDPMTHHLYCSHTSFIIVLPKKATMIFSYLKVIEYILCMENTFFPLLSNFSSAFRTDLEFTFLRKPLLICSSKFRSLLIYTFMAQYFSFTDLVMTEMKDIRPD